MEYIEAGGESQISSRKHIRTYYQKRNYEQRSIMTRGNQRDLARAKNLKKTQDAAKKNKDDGLNATARKERDADVMRQKQQSAAAKKEGGPSGEAGASGGKK